MGKLNQVISNGTKGALRFIENHAVRLAEEPPFRLFAKEAVKALPISVRTKAKWDAAERPQYLVGVLEAADEAAREGISEISAIEFGVAGGKGLLALEKYAVGVEAETKVRIAVFGFDNGKGLPTLCGDYRDHPDQWRCGDFPMDEQTLRTRLSKRTTLLIGDVKQTVPQFIRENQSSPVGFVAVDLDLYTSTKEALQIFLLPGKQILRRVVMYFDDVHMFYNHRFAGELLAIEEFNQSNDQVKLDHWRGNVYSRVFPESSWVRNMYVAHDIVSISRMSLARPARNQGTRLSS